MTGVPKPFSKLKIALVADDLTRCALHHECRVWDITPRNYQLVFRLWKPDLLLVESVWNGWKKSWKFKVASYEDHPERTNARLAAMVATARDLGIPCVFWNKEDGVHFNRFIKSAVLFDAIFTVDENCLPAYRAKVKEEVPVGVLMFAVQPRIHYPSETLGQPRYPRGCFVGSYSWHIHDRRRAWQDMYFRAASEIGLTVFDRNSDRKAAHYRFPPLPGLEVNPCVTYDKTAQIYRDYMVNLNVNTIEDSATMFSRRLVEIVACGGLAVTNPTPAVERHFRDYCHVVATEEEGTELFRQLKQGLRPQDIEMIRRGADFVGRNHTWAHRLETILNAVK